MARQIHWSSVDPTRFFTYAPLGEKTKGSLGPVVIWVRAIPGSTSADTAHEVPREILSFLLKNRVEGVVVEWREAVPQRLAGPSATSTAAMPPIMSVASLLLFSTFPSPQKE